MPSRNRKRKDMQKKKQPLEPHLKKVVMADELDTMKQLLDTRVFELTALARIADALTEIAETLNKKGAK